REVATGCDYEVGGPVPLPSNPPLCVAREFSEGTDPGRLRALFRARKSGRGGGVAVAGALEAVQHLAIHADHITLHHAHEPALAARAIEDNGRLERARLAVVQEMDTVQPHAVRGRARPELRMGLDVGLRARHQANATSCAWGAQRGPQKRTEERGLANGSAQLAQARIHQPRGLISLRRNTKRLSGC